MAEALTLNAMAARSQRAFVVIGEAQLPLVTSVKSMQAAAPASLYW